MSCLKNSTLSIGFSGEPDYQEQATTSFAVAAIVTMAVAVVDYDAVVVADCFGDESTMAAQVAADAAADDYEVDCCCCYCCDAIIMAAGGCHPWSPMEAVVVAVPKQKGCFVIGEGTSGNVSLASVDH